MELIRSIRKELVELAENTLPGDEVRRKKIDQGIIKSYMLFKRLETLHESLPEEEQLVDYENFCKKHMTFLAEYFSKYMLKEI